MDDFHMILLWILLMMLIAFVSLGILLGSKAKSRWTDVGNLGSLVGIAGLVLGTPFLWLVLKMLPAVSAAQQALLNP